MNIAVRSIKKLAAALSVVMGLGTAFTVSAQQTVTVKELCMDYLDNEVRFQDNYKGKLFYIEGTVNAIERGILSAYVVTLDGPGFSCRDVKIRFPGEMPEAVRNKLSNLNKYEKIRVPVEGSSIYWDFNAILNSDGSSIVVLPKDTKTNAGDSDIFTWVIIIIVIIVALALIKYIIALIVLIIKGLIAIISLPFIVIAKICKGVSNNNNEHIEEVDTVIADRKNEQIFEVADKSDDKEKSEGQRFCGQCGTMVTEGNKFCNKCGNAL